VDSAPDLPGDVPPPGAFRGVWRADLEARAVYSEAAGVARALPRAVAVPADADDVGALARWASATGTPLVPRGAGSSMAGGAVGDGVAVDLSRLDALGPVDAAARRVWAGPGVTGAAVDRAARAAGLRFPVDPSSWEWATVGGMAATNAAGAHTLRHGAMRPWVRALDCVFADGARAVVRRGEAPPDVPAVRGLVGDVLPRVRAALATGVPLAHATRKESSGYALAAWARSGELVDLLVGSEGTLALFVGVELALAPPPGATASALGAFPSLEAAALGAERAREAGAAACELLDRTFLDVAAEGGALPDAARGPGGLVPEAVLLAEAEADDAGAAAALAAALGDAFRAAGAERVALAVDPAAERALWALRHAASPTLARLDPRLKSMQFVEDGCVPPGRLPDYVRGVRAALERRGVRGVIFGHAGDAHAHVNPLVDVSRPGWRDDVGALLDEVSALAASLGGTLAGEHGDGRLRTPLLARTWAPGALALFAEAKRACDPAGVLNPGVKVPLAGQVPLGAVKYDPALPPLPPAARRALDRVADRRAYAAYRLALLDACRDGDAPADGTPAGHAPAGAAPARGTPLADGPPGPP
jgi:FAD/FMN-containing dehydrogenase